MPFIGTYNGAMKLLNDIEKGTCKGNCKSIWIRNIRYALKTKTNPLGLNKTQRKNITAKIKKVSKRNTINNHKKTLKNRKK